jgi:hypothetical protein
LNQEYYLSKDGGSIASRNYITLNEDNTVSDLFHLSSLIDYLSNTLTSLMLSIPDYFSCVHYDADNKEYNRQQEQQQEQQQQLLPQSPGKNQKKNNQKNWDSYNDLVSTPTIPALENSAAVIVIDESLILYSDTVIFAIIRYKPYEASTILNMKRNVL